LAAISIGQQRPGSGKEGWRASDRRERADVRADPAGAGGRPDGAIRPTAGTPRRSEL